MDLETNRIVRLPQPGTYVIAVSGGVDSVVLLDIFAKVLPGTYNLIVAHFDHGIRTDSRQDCLLVAKLAQLYGYIFESKREELGEGTSEEVARNRRYKFLRDIAKKHSAGLVTAHHGDDCVETVAINLTRGTGWRGLAVLDSDVYRPLLDVTKQEIFVYAAERKLIWNDDSTNVSDVYLRNRIRHKTSQLDSDTKRQLLGLRAHQVALKKQIKLEVESLIGGTEVYSRYFFTGLDNATAIECLRSATTARLTRPQLTQALLAIKTARPGSVYQAGNSVQFRFTSRNFAVELIK